MEKKTFRPVFYIISGWPSLEKTREMVDRYIQHGVRALQFDMPSKDPSREAEFIQERMRHARSLYPSYDTFMQALRDIRQRHPELEIHLVVYPDVVEDIGRERFTAFCKEIGVYSLLAGSVELLRYFNAEGIPTATFIGYDTAEDAIALARQNDNQIVFLSNSNGRTEPRPGLVSWAERVAYIRESGVKAPIFGVTGISTPEQLQEVKEAGADGAYIGTVIMKLWENETELWNSLDAFQAVADK